MIYWNYMSSNKSEIIVTGINGFVGEHLARQLKEAGFSVRGVGRESTPNQKVGEHLTAYDQADLLDAESISPIAFKDAAAIIHLAGLASVADSFNNPELYHRANAEMTHNLLDKATTNDFKGRAVVVSTGALYDASQPMPLSETSQTTESSPYAIGKLKAEQVAKDFKSLGHDIVIARPFNHIGPGQGKGFLVPDLYDQLRDVAANDESTILVGNLTTKRDYTDVRDIVAAYIQLATAPSLEHDTYNISTGTSYSGLEVLEFLKSAAGLSAITPVIDQSRVRPTDAMEITGNSSRLQNELGWKPVSTVQKAIADFVAREQA
jgi:GDP-4-dehydro-6-deoxy-D-mannose reductase